MDIFFKNLISTAFLGLLCLVVHAEEDYYAKYRQHWLHKAALNMPDLIISEKKPTHVIEVVKDSSSFQGWKIKPVKTIDTFYTTLIDKKSPIILDFGEHLTGYFTFALKPTKETPDAPVRFKFTFGEVPSEIAAPFEPYTGTLSRAWLQDEVVTVMTLPDTITIPRRLSFRYVKIEVIASPTYDFYMPYVSLNASTSAAKTPKPLASSAPEIIKKIDEVALVTLRECMQTVYEDGPKRDQRLWIGDLYLQAMTNNYSFLQHYLTRRSLYLLAGLSDKNGYLHPCVYERPEPHGNADLFLLEYSLLFNVTLKDYLEATNDTETAVDLWPAAKKQLDIIYSYLKDDGLIDYKRYNEERWIHIDWREGLHKEVALQGVCIFAAKNTYDLAKMIGKEKEVSDLPRLAQKMTKAAHKNFHDKKTGFFIGKFNNQISYASQIWMILSEVASRREAQTALRNLKTVQQVTRPGSPYLYHYYIQSLIDCGLHQEAKQELVQFWGGMIEKGADTFWEVYDPNDDFLSPYNFYLINSYCHAWSCTPTYFIRKYPEIFQN